MSVLLSVVTVLLCLGMSEDAEASTWIYDDRCSETSSSSFDLQSPNALFMLDQSGSMKGTLWNSAVSSIGEVTNEFVVPGACSSPDDPNCDRVRVGLGLFYTGNYEEPCTERYKDYYTVRQRETYTSYEQKPYKKMVPVEETYHVRKPYEVPYRTTEYYYVREPYQKRVTETYTTKVWKYKWVTKMVTTYDTVCRWLGIRKLCRKVSKRVPKRVKKWFQKTVTRTRTVTKTRCCRRVRKSRTVWKTKTVCCKRVKKTRTVMRERQVCCKPRRVTKTRWVTKRKWRWRTRQATCRKYGDRVHVPDPVREDNRQNIMNTLDAESPNGGTPTGKAMKKLHQESSLKDDERVNVGVLITDGKPSGSNEERQAVEYACKMRDRNDAPAETYVLGFSSGTDTAYNDMLAAAGGTGTCSNGDPCDNPSNYNHYKGHCSGSYQADSPAEFKQALLSITDEIACTFELDLPDTYEDGKAYEDPEATRLRIYHKNYGWIWVPHRSTGRMSDEMQAAGAPRSVANQYRNQGWEFANDKRTKVKLTEKICDGVASGDVEEVTTQVACACPDYGDACEVAGRSGECARGQYDCKIGPGEQVCEPIYDRNEALDQECEVPAMEGRCGVGRLACAAGQEICEPVNDPMPEVCNGLDDDCDGAIDNLSTSWLDFDDIEITDKATEAACNMNDVCRCPDGVTGEHAITDGDFTSRLEDHLDSAFDNDCFCGESLAGDW